MIRIECVTRCDNFQIDLIPTKKHNSKYVANWGKINIFLKANIFDDIWKCEDAKFLKKYFKFAIWPKKVSCAQILVLMVKKCIWGDRETPLEF